MARIPAENDHRGNMHVGATIASFELSERDKNMFDHWSFLKKHNLLFVGIDIIGEYLTEINVTSPTGIQEINKLQQTYLEKDVLDAAIFKNKINKSKKINVTLSLYYVVIELYLL